MVFLGPKAIEKIPFTEGPYLGMMKNEYPNSQILSFYSGGCKQWGMEIRDNKTGNVHNILKCRGLTLDTSNEDQFNFKTFKVKIIGYFL